MTIGNQAHSDAQRLAGTSLVIGRAALAALPGAAESLAHRTHI